VVQGRGDGIGFARRSKSVNVHVNVPVPGSISMAFDHEKLDVYQLAVEFVSKADELLKELPRGRGYLTDQLQRASLHVVLNIAEGAGKFSPRDKASFYTRARGSAMESAAVLDVCSRLKLINDENLKDNKMILERIVQMLTKLAKIRS